RRQIQLLGSDGRVGGLVRVERRGHRADRQPVLEATAQELRDDVRLIEGEVSEVEDLATAVLPLDQDGVVPELVKGVFVRAKREDVDLKVVAVLGARGARGDGGGGQAGGSTRGSQP